MFKTIAMGSSIAMVAMAPLTIPATLVMTNYNASSFLVNFTKVNWSFVKMAAGL